MSCAIRAIQLHMNELHYSNQCLPLGHEAAPCWSQIDTLFCVRLIAFTQHARLCMASSLTFCPQVKGLCVVHCDWPCMCSPWPLFNWLGYLIYASHVGVHPELVLYAQHFNTIRAARQHNQGRTKTAMPCRERAPCVLGMLERSASLGICMNVSVQRCTRLVSSALTNLSCV